MDPRRCALLLLAVALGAVFSGCIAPPTDPGDGAMPGRDPDAPQLGTPVAFDAACHFTFCYESNVAADAAGRIFVTAALGDGIEVSEDGGATWLVLPAPALPVPRTPVGTMPDSFANDAFLQVDAQGRLYFSALISSAVYGAFGFQQVISGLQVARSDDGGNSWPVNTFVSAASNPDGLTARTDRQWLAFGPGETVYLFHRNPDAGGIVARSDDGGRTFGRSVIVLSGLEGGYVAGYPMADSAGHVYWPFYRYARDAQVSTDLEVAVSQDKGATWRIHVVNRENTGSVFPVLAIGSGGALHVAWRTYTHAIVVATSQDEGETWGAPVNWTTPGSQAAWSSPWILARDGRIDVAWFAAEAPDEDENATLILSRSFDGGAHISSSSIGMVHGDSFSPTNTDFAHAAMMPDGRITLPYSNYDEQNIIHVVVAEAPDGRGE